MTGGRTETWWRLYGRHRRLAATFEAKNRDDAERKVRALLKAHNRDADHDRVCRSDTCNWWGINAHYGFLARGRREYWSAVTAKSVGNEDSDYGTDTVWHVHPDCVGHQHLSEEEARKCIPNAHGYMRRVGRTLIYDR